MRGRRAGLPSRRLAQVAGAQTRAGACGLPAAPQDAGCGRCDSERQMGAARAHAVGCCRRRAVTHVFAGARKRLVACANVGGIVHKYELLARMRIAQAACAEAGGAL